MKRHEEILKEIENARLSLDNIEKILSITKNTHIIKTTEEYEEAIKKVASFLSKKQDANTLRGMKHRLENNKREISLKEAYQIQEKFGIPIYAWKDLAWYKQSLVPPPDKKEK